MATRSTNLENMSPSLACENLNRYLGEGDQRVHVLRSISLELFPGTMYSIVGASGSGKSTLLYLLGLLDKADSGKIIILDQVITPDDDDRRTALRNRHIGFVYQFHYLLREFSALENVMLPMLRLEESGPRPDLEKRALELLDAVGLAHKAHRRAHQLSGGEQQRVAIARALANSPSILLADEPTGNLDSSNSERVFDLLLKLTRERALTSLVVTHNPTVAEECDVTFTMCDGAIVHTCSRRDNRRINAK